MKTTINAIFIFAIWLLLISLNGTPEASRIFYINSYHQGYGSSDEIMRGMNEVFAEKTVILETFFMDTKRQSAEEQIQAQAKIALARIHQFQPDVIIASDDNAVKYVIAPHFRNGPIPVVFCGVNWSCEQYDLPTPYVTGMLEVLPIEATIQTLKASYPASQKLVVLSENTTSERNNTALLDSLYRRLGLIPTHFLVDNFEQWQQKFIEANQMADLLYLPTNGAIKGWDNPVASEFVAAHIKIPVFTCDDFMMPFAVFGQTKIASEQGEWAAETALKILAGNKPDVISVTRNEQSQIYVNERLAAIINLHLPPELLERVVRIP